MSESGALPRLAAQTLAEIAEIDRRISSLVELRDGLKRVFLNASNLELKDALGMCSSESRRSVIEHVILDTMRNADGRCLKTRELFEGARAISAHLKYVTFRSYLHRLKQRGLITAENTEYGSWKLVEGATGGRRDLSAPPPQ